MNAGDYAHKLLIVPDCHAHPSYDSQRFAWLGAFIEREKPSHVVCLGDFADMWALSSYDRGKRGFEGRRYVKDVACTREALAALHGEVTCSPEWLMCLGNHEDRIDRATSDSAELTGAISIDDLGYRDHGWQVQPYQSTLVLGGFAISHHFPSGVGNRPIGGDNHAASLIRRNHMSSIVGHSHTFDTAIQTRPDKSRIFALVAGCYVHLQHHESWSAATERMWVNGVTVLDEVRAGWCEGWRFVPQTQLRDAYVPRAAPPEPQPEPGACFDGLDFDDLGETAAHPTYADAARATGRDESSVRAWCQRRGAPPTAYVAWVAEQRA